jgi:hypothetical protein
MARNGGRKRTARPKRTRQKLDPRLAYLLSIPSSRLRAMKSSEEREHQRLGEERRALLAAPSRTREPREHAQRLAEVERRTFMPLTAGVHLPQRKAKTPGEPYVSALVLSDGNAADLTRLGARVRSHAGDVFSVFVPMSAIRRLEASSIVHFIELARLSRSNLDEAVPFAGMDTLHKPPASVTGKDVVVGILDTKLDFYHPDFCSAPNNSRVLFLWDQTLTAQGREAPPPKGPPLPGFAPATGSTYGVEYSKADIDAELSAFNPAAPNAYQIVRHRGDPADRDHQHGTHVASIAVGNGRADPARRFTGAAPGADLIFVGLQKPQPEQPMADSTALLDGFAYVFARAAQLGKPCVINRSGSDNQGPHDGTNLGERFLDNLLSTPGRAITLASGNSNSDRSHATGDVAAGTETRLVLNYQAGATKADDVEIWYDGHDRFDVTVTIPTTPPTVIGPLSPGFMAAQAAGPDVEVQVVSTLNDPRNGDNAVTIFISLTNGAQIPPGNWLFGLTGTTVINGRFHAWVDRNNRGKSAWRPPHVQGDKLTLGVPATARRPITVGFHDKSIRPAADAASGRGPTRDGRIKPDIAATGVDVTAARLRDMSLSEPGDLYRPELGSSMSAPLVAGACALLFECRGPNLSCADLKQILQTTAGTAGMSTVPDDAFGFGYLQMANACSTPAPDVDVWLRDDDTDDGVEPFGGTVAWLSPDIEVLDASGNPVANPSHDATRRFSNIVRVTVRNRGTQPARNTEIFLYWADPATSLPFPGAWNSSGIFVGEAPDFVQQGNSIVLPTLPAGASAQIRFAWAPPAPGSRLRGDDHFCLLARLENQADPSQIGAGGQVVITARNNIALRNVHVQPLSRDRSQMRFYMEGTPDDDSVRVEPVLAGGHVELRIPIHVLRWRDAGFIERYGGGRGGVYGKEELEKLRALRMELKGREIQRRVNVEGAELLEARDGFARIVLDTNERALWLRHLRLQTGVRVPAGVSVTSARIKGRRCFVHVAQYSGERLAGGVSLELRSPFAFRKPRR